MRLLLAVVRRSLLAIVSVSETSRALLFIPQGVAWMRTNATSSRSFCLWEPLHISCFRKEVGVLGAEDEFKRLIFVRCHELMFGESHNIFMELFRVPRLKVLN